MGIVAFKWENNQLLLLQNRDNFDHLRIKPVAWDEGDQILRGWLEPEGGTWFGISRTGRVAFLVDAMVFTDVNRCVMLPLDFLQGEMSPEEFAMQKAEELVVNNGMIYNLIVADITSNSMFYINKRSAMLPFVHTEPVGFGVHLISLGGLDNTTFTKDKRMRGAFSEMVGEYRDKELPPLKEVAAKFMYDPQEDQEGYNLGAFHVDMKVKEKQIPLPENYAEERRYRTTSTTALEVKPNKEVKLYERYLEDGEWKDHDFTFNIV